MRAIVHDRYGIDALRLEEVEKPPLTDDGVLVRIRASSVNREQCYKVSGVPWFLRLLSGLFRPRKPIVPGVDFAGTVEAVGKDVDHVRAGDEVFGGRTGAYAEYVCAREAVVLKPPSLSFEEAAAIPTAAITALQGLRDRAGLQANQRVLINGASGGVGIYAVQIAKALGAEVTAVCSTRNVSQAHELGADHVIDYQKEDFTQREGRYDVVFDIAGSQPWRHAKKVLTADGVLVQAGAPMGGRILGPLRHLVLTRLASLGSRRKVVPLLANFNRPDMDALHRLLDEGQVRPVIERIYTLDSISDALHHVAEGHARAKVVIRIWAGGADPTTTRATPARDARPPVGGVPGGDR